MAVPEKLYIASDCSDLLEKATDSLTCGWVKGVYGGESGGVSWGGATSKRTE